MEIGGEEFRVQRKEFRERGKAREARQLGIRNVYDGGLAG